MRPKPSSKRNPQSVSLALTADTVDNLGTLYSDPYATLDLRAEYRLVKGMAVYAEVTNLLDATYAASTLIVDQARADQAVFLPGDGRAIGAGLRLTF